MDIYHIASLLIVVIGAAISIGVMKQKLKDAQAEIGCVKMKVEELEKKYYGIDAANGLLKQELEHFTADLTEIKGDIKTILQNLVPGLKGIL